MSETSSKAREQSFLQTFCSMSNSAWKDGLRGQRQRPDEKETVVQINDLSFTYDDNPLQKVTALQRDDG